MAAYEVTARIAGVAPRRVRAVPVADAAARTVDDEAPIDHVGRPLDVELAERWEAFRERWAQTTFYLFDPDSWR